MESKPARYGRNERRCRAPEASGSDVPLIPIENYRHIRWHVAGNTDFSNDINFLHTRVQIALEILAMWTLVKEIRLILPSPCTIYFRSYILKACRIDHSHIITPLPVLIIFRYSLLIFLDMHMNLEIDRHNKVRARARCLFASHLCNIKAPSVGRGAGSGKIQKWCCSQKKKKNVIFPRGLAPRRRRSRLYEQLRNKEEANYI